MLSNIMSHSSKPFNKENCANTSRPTNSKISNRRDKGSAPVRAVPACTFSPLSLRFRQTAELDTALMCSVYLIQERIAPAISSCCITLHISNPNLTDSFLLVLSSGKEMKLMLNNAFCCTFSTRSTALMHDHGLISLQEISICIIRHRTVKFPLAHGTSVPI